MKSLHLLRHAKSSWDDPVDRDFDRPLNARGRRAALAMGQWLAGEGLAFDRVLASPAARILETISGVESGLGRPLAARHDRRIYMASAATLFDLVRETADDTGNLLLIGHNPGLEDLLLLATEGDTGPLRREAELKYPTATFATLSLPISRWADLAEGGARLTRFVRPRDLDPALGPDD